MKRLEINCFEFCRNGMTLSSNLKKNLCLLKKKEAPGMFKKKTEKNSNNQTCQITPIKGTIKKNRKKIPV